MLYHFIIIGVPFHLCELISELAEQSEEVQKQQSEKLEAQEQELREQKQKLQTHNQMLQSRLQEQQLQSELFQQKLQELETKAQGHSDVTELKEELAMEKQHSAVLQGRLQHVEQDLQRSSVAAQTLQVKCDYLEQELQTEKAKFCCLENTVIAGLVQRMETLEVAVHAVERLWVVSRDEVHLSNNILGTGGWGYVTEATYRGRKVAAKCLHENIASPHNLKLFEKEIQLFARCRHPNLLEFIGAVSDHPAIILTEIMDTNLRQALTQRRATPNHIHPISMNIAQALLYLHSIQPHPLIHRDVSAPNVLLKADGNGWIAKLSDLGSAQFAHIAQTLVPGAVIYAAPEVTQRDSARQQTVKIDIYSYGVLLIEMLTREMPTSSVDMLLRSIQLRWPRFVPLITSCTNVDPDKRPSIRQVIDQLDTMTI